MPVSATELSDLQSCLRDVGAVLRTSALNGVRSKGALDVVSDLDMQAERTVTEFLRARFPGDAVLSEESARTVQFAERIWVLDPLDGTVNRTSGIPFYGVSLALLEHGVPALGFVYDPEHDEMFVAERGAGARLNGQQLQVSTDEVHGLTITSKLMRQMVRQAPKELYEILARHGRLRNIGAQALQLCYVAAGRLSAAVSLETMLWDNAAGWLMVAEAGGVVTDLAGHALWPLTADSTALRGMATPCLAATPSAHARLLPFFRALAQ